jgi:hypothetical protein
LAFMVATTVIGMGTELLVGCVLDECRAYLSDAFMQRFAAQAGRRRHSICICDPCGRWWYWGICD